MSEHAGQIAAATGEDPAGLRQGPERCRSPARETGQGPGRVPQSNGLSPSIGFFSLFFMSFLGSVLSIIGRLNGKPSFNPSLVLYYYYFFFLLLLWPSFLMYTFGYLISRFIDPVPEREGEVRLRLRQHAGPVGQIGGPVVPRPKGEGKHPTRNGANSGETRQKPGKTSQISR